MIVVWAFMVWGVLTGLLSPTGFGSPLGGVRQSSDPCALLNIKVEGAAITTSRSPVLQQKHILK